MLHGTATSIPTLRPVARDLRWFAHIDRHGPQSSEMLFEATRDSHRCKDTALRRLQALREAGYLFLPRQQRQIAKADFNPFVYDLTPAGFEVLSYEKALERDTRPTGHWWHGFWVSVVTGAVEVCAGRQGATYIPASTILGINNVSAGIPLDGGVVIPDQLFAIKYADGYRAFALELDRGTEPVRSKAARKSLQRSVTQYRDLLSRKLYQRHYGLKSNLTVLWVFLSKARQRQWQSMLTDADQQQQSAVCLAEFPHWKDLQDTVADLPLHL